MVSEELGMDRLRCMLKDYRKEKDDLKLSVLEILQNDNARRKAY